MIDVDTTELSQRVEQYPAEVPAGVIVLTCGVDVQDDRLEYEVVGWGRGSESWGIQAGVLWGDPEQPDVWAELDVLLGRQWLKEDGIALAIRRTAIDAMGHKTDSVYRYCKPRMKLGVFAIQGKGGPGHPLVGKPKANNRYGAQLFPLGVDGAKTTLMGRVDATMALNPETDRIAGPGICHWPSDPARGYNAEWFAQLMAEEKKYKGTKGHQVPYWQPIRKRNEALDCRIYATAALVILSPTLAILSEPVTIIGNRSRTPRKRRTRRMVRR
ncbi:MAG: terminase gpA endonuclease subunit [Planctomycetota bacterium]|nr:terminase gpA endonuclease subunit [Planctomycetota bacterium]